MTNFQSQPIDKALTGYLNEANQFTRLPGKKQKRKLDLMIDFLASLFAPEVIYSEHQVNEILNKVHSFNDPATLRRLLIGTGRLGRSVDGREYWLVSH